MMAAPSLFTFIAFHLTYFGSFLGLLRMSLFDRKTFWVHILVDSNFDSGFQISLLVLSILCLTPNQKVKSKRARADIIIIVQGLATEGSHFSNLMYWLGSGWDMLNGNSSTVSRRQCSLWLCAIEFIFACFFSSFFSFSYFWVRL